MKAVQISGCAINYSLVEYQKHYGAMMLHYMYMQKQKDISAKKIPRLSTI